MLIDNCLQNNLKRVCFTFNITLVTFTEIISYVDWIESKIFQELVYKYILYSSTNLITI